MAKTTLQAIADIHPAMKAKYDCSRAHYHGALAPMTGLQCPQHGEFKQYPAQLRKNGAGCPECGAEVRRAKRRLTLDQVLERARAKHGDKYDYSRVVYGDHGKEEIIIGCPVHGFVPIVANLHIHAGRGCPRCGDERRGRNVSLESRGRGSRNKAIRFAAKFVADAREVHGDLYDYSSSNYVKQKIAVTIVCPTHGPFEQTPEKHIRRRQGCPGCSHHRSKGEEALVRFMAPFATLVERSRAIVPPTELDIYAPDHALAVEYCGEYWHGHDTPEDERKAKHKHANKHRACKAKGIRLLTVFESEWLNHGFAIRRLIRNALGKGRGSVMARKCVREKVPSAEARAFFDKYHPQGGAGYGEHYGLRYNGKLVACMRFTHGSNDRGTHAERMWTLSRYATRLSVVGGASRLLAAFVADFNPPEIKSFSDNRYFTGGMYEKLGFALEEDGVPDYQVYHQRLGLMPKSAWQRREIPNRIRDLKSKETFNPDKNIDKRSEQTMTFLLGAHRIYDCGKKRWVWRAPSL